MAHNFTTDVQLGGVPDPKLIKGGQEFSKAAAGQDSVSALLSQVANAGDSAKGSAAVVTTGPGLPALPKKLVDRILADQYVDFADFPPAKGRTRPMPAAEESHIIVIRAEDINGARKLIPDLPTWVQCFNVYLAVILEREPSRTKSLLAYMNTIVKASTKYKWPSWIVYDQNYRQEAVDNGLKDWSKVDPSTFTQCFTNAAISSENWCKVCQSMDHATEVCPNKMYGGMPRKRNAESLGQPPYGRKRPAPGSSLQVCRLFNRSNGECKFGEACIYQHKCDQCGSTSHSRSKCPDLRRST
jgi:hypothetical protein